MADRALRFDLLGRDRTLSRTLGQAEGRFKRFGGAAVKISGVVAGAFAGIQVAGFLKDAIAEARDAAKVGRQTAAVIKATGGVAKVSAKDVDRLAEALSNKVGVDDEVIAAGQNMLLTFKGVRNETGKNNDIFTQAARVALDMTAALHQGEISQSGLEKSTIMLGKALNDPLKGLTALQRVGVTFTKAQKDQIATLVKSGKTMEAQKIILGELKTEFGGAAAAAADPWQRFSVLMGNIKERIGTVLMPALVGVLDYLTKTLIPGIETFFQGLGDKIGPAAKTLTDAIQARFDVVKIDLGKFLRNLADRIKKIGQPLIDAFVDSVKAGDWSKFGGALADAIQEAVGDGTALLSKAFAKVDWVKVGETVGKHALGFAVGFVAAFGSDLITVAREHPLDLVVFITSFLAIGKVGGVIARVLSKIPFLRAFAPLFEGLSKLTGPINDAIGKLVSLFGKGFSEGFQRVFPKAAGLVRRAIGDVLAWLALRAEAFRNAAGRLIKGLAAGIGEEIGLVVKNIGQVIRALTRPFLGIGGWLVRRGVELLAGLVRGIVSVFGRVSSTIASVIARVLNPFRPSLRWLSRAGQNIVDGLVSGMRSAMGAVGDIVRNLKDAIVGGIKRLFGISSPSKVMASLGGNIVEGLVRGLVTSRSGLQAILKSMGADVTEAFAGLGGGGSKGLVGFAASAFKFFSSLFPGMTIGGWRAKGSVPGSDHPKGKALDLMTTSSTVASMIIAAFRMLPGAKYWIWNRQIATASSGWRTHGYSGPNPHTDHVHLSFFGKGGIITQPTLGIVGEAGPEAVIPLPSRGGLMRPDGGPTAKEIARELAKALQDNPPVVAVRDLQAGMNRYAGRFGQARPYR